jgi:hypothetical protein
VHAAHANFADYRLSTLVTYYGKLAPWTGLYLLGFSSVLLAAGVHLYRTAPDRAARVARLGTLLLAAAAFWYFSVRSPNKSYYLLMLAPAVALTALVLLDRSTVASRRAVTFPLAIAAAFFGLFSLFFVRDAALFANYLNHGVSFFDAQAEFRSLPQTSEKISVSESLWVLADDYRRIRRIERGSASGDVMVVQQSQRQSLVPPSFPGYRMVSERFVSRRPTLFGLPIGRTMPGYSFAVYEKDPSP